jgi:Mg-chelatase subunit ChlD
MRFKDPCSEEDQKQFALCNHQCPSSDHVSSAVGSSSASPAQQQISCCPEILWHAPIPKAKAQVSGTGYVTDDGHYFSCDHSKNMVNHVIFVIDRSSSMGTADCRPTLVKFSQSHANRLGSVYDAIVRFIRTRLAAGLKDSMSVVLFDTTATTAFECQDMAENLTDQLLQYHPSGGTTYSCGIAEAEALLSRASKIQAIQRKSPTVIFLSDGENFGGSNPVQLVKGMKQVEPKLVFHTIKFGSSSYSQILKDMASAGSGTFQVSLDEVQLSKSFEGLARSLRPKVTALM